VVAAHPGIAERGALLLRAERLAHERVDVDDQPPVTGAGAGRPRALDRLAKDAVELADVPKRERSQKRPQRRRRHHLVPQHVRGAARAQHVAVVDAVRAERDRRHQRHHLRARVARSGALAEIHARVDKRLDPEPPGERRRQDDSSVGDRPLIIETDRDAIQSDRPVNMHHEGDLLSQAATAPIGRFSPAQEVILRLGPDGTRSFGGGSRLNEPDDRRHSTRPNQSAAGYRVRARPAVRADPGSGRSCLDAARSARV
jgi:hypothetical protein